MVIFRRRGSRSDVDHRFARLVDKHVGSAMVRAASWFRSNTPSARRPPPAEIGRILLIKFHGIGNIVMLLPSLRALARRYPEAEIDFLSLATNREILSDTGELSKTILLDAATPLRFFFSVVRTLPTIRARRYDLAVDFEQFARVSAILAALSGARIRVGFDTPGQSREGLYTVPVAYREHLHMSRLFLRLSEAAGADIPGLEAEKFDRRIELMPSHYVESRAVEAAAGADPGTPLVVMHPGSGGNLPLRRWPAERFGALARLFEERLGARVVLSGGPHEAALAERVAAASGGRAMNAAGRLSVKGLAALCERAEWVVSNDTSTIHVASAMGTPVVGLYGPNTPFLYGPVGADDILFYKAPECSPCLTNESLKLSNCVDARCMEAIGVEEVFESVCGKFFDAEGSLFPRFKKDRGIGGVS